MNHFTKFAVISALALGVVACAPEKEPTGVIPEGHLKAMEKANNVEGMLNDAQKKQMEEVDKAAN